MSKNPKDKGDQFENFVCRRLTEWFYGYDMINAKASDLVFRRRTTSIQPVEGHWSGAGDLVHRPGIRWPFAVECKKVEDVGLDGLFTRGGNWPVWKYWAQCLDQSFQTGQLPFMVFAKNRFPPLVMVVKEHAHFFGMRDRQLQGAKVDIMSPIEAQLPKSNGRFFTEEVTVVTLGDLIDVVSYNEVVKLYEIEYGG